MNARRGLSMLEVLLSVALMTSIAAACLPLIRGAAAVSVAQHDASIDALALRALADAQEDGALAAAGLFDGSRLIVIPWPDAPERPPVRAATCSAPSDGHAWVRFTCEGLAVTRWVRLPDPVENQNGAPP